jgi:hypothetical protein
MDILRVPSPEGNYIAEQYTAKMLQINTEVEGFKKLS